MALNWVNTQSALSLTTMSNSPFNVRQKRVSDGMGSLTIQPSDRHCSIAGANTVASSFPNRPAKERGEESNNNGIAARVVAHRS